MNTLRGGQPRNLGSFTGKGKNIALSQFARLALGPTQSPLQWLMEISGQAMKLTAHLNLAPRSKVHGAISPLHHKFHILYRDCTFSFILCGKLCHSLFSKLHHGWYYVCLYLQCFVTTIFRLEVTCIQNCNDLFVLSLIRCRISDNPPTGDQDGWSGLSQTLDEITI